MEQFPDGGEGFFATFIKSRQFNAVQKALTPLGEPFTQRRNELKKIDFWLRYLEPIVQKHVNGPLSGGVGNGSL